MIIWLHFYLLYALAFHSEGAAFYVFVWGEGDWCVGTIISLMVKFTLEQATKAYRGRSSIGLPFKLSGRYEWVVNAIPTCLTPREGHLVPIVQEGGWDPRPVWMGAENIAPTRIWSLDLPTCSKSLYQLCYLSPYNFTNRVLFFCKKYLNSQTSCIRTQDQIANLRRIHVLYSPELYCIL
jgi:hypothetical protein